MSTHCSRQCTSCRTLALTLRVTCDAPMSPARFGHARLERGLMEPHRGQAEPFPQQANELRKTPSPCLPSTCTRARCSKCLLLQKGQLFHNGRNGRETKAATAPRTARSRRRRLEARSVRRCLEARSVRRYPNTLAAHILPTARSARFGRRQTSECACRCVAAHSLRRTGGPQQTLPPLVVCCVRSLFAPSPSLLLLLHTYSVVPKAAADAPLYNPFRWLLRSASARLAAVRRGHRGRAIMCQTVG